MTDVATSSRAKSLGAAPKAAEIIKTYQRHLPPGTLTHFRVDALDHLDIPVVTARLLLATGGSLEGIGYGATADDALVGALGELSEEAHCDRALGAAPRVQGSYEQLVNERGAHAVVDPLTLCLPAGSSYSPQQLLTWVQARRLANHEPVLVPEEFAAEAPGQLRSNVKPLVTPITNGLGAGLGFEQALVHGVLELLQRDGNVLSYRALDQGVAIDLDRVDDPVVRDLLTRYRARGVDVVAKVAATDFGMLNVYVVGAEPHPLTAFPLRLTACGEAVHPDRERALRKALLEFAGSRARKSFRHGAFDRITQVAPPEYLDRVLPKIDLSKEEARALHGMSEWLLADDVTLRRLLHQKGILATKSTVPLSELPTVELGSVDDPVKRLQVVASRLAQTGLDVLYVDFSPPGREVFVVKAIVPGLESETLSYHRIGERGVRRLLDRESSLVHVGEAVPGTERVRLTKQAEDRLGGPVWLDTRALDDLVGDLYPLYREPSGHAAQLYLSRQRAVASQAVSSAGAI
ncbi:MAG TPA: YcaO-like family protein [Burkholderiaceae bacterium]|nr:YcaO-like family protein [Burkholderiaceae bacterium]